MKPKTFYLNKDKNRLSVLGQIIVALNNASGDTAKAYKVEITERKKDYTPKQRRSMFGVAYKALMEFSGLQGEDEKRELHHFMCGEFWGWKQDAFGRLIPKRTTTVNEAGERELIGKDEAARFYEFLQRKGAEVGCNVPDPDPLWNDGRFD